jgi:hypothetical protein
MAATQSHDRERAEALLARAKNYAPSSAARLATLAEAQVHATLALADAPAAEKAAPAPRRAKAAKPAASTEEAGK